MLGATHCRRNSPDLAEPGAVWGEPLDDVFLSRGPMNLERARGGGIEIALGECATAVRVAGMGARTNDLNVLLPWVVSRLIGSHRAVDPGFHTLR